MRQISQPESSLHPYLLNYFCYIAIHMLFNLPRIRQCGRNFCTVCHTPSVLLPLINTHPYSLELFVTAALRSSRCYKLLLCTLCSSVIAIPLGPHEKDVLISLTCPGLCRRLVRGWGEIRHCLYYLQIVAYCFPTLLLLIVLLPRSA